MNWKRNLWVLWLTTAIDGIAFSEVIPFLSLYVGQLGNFSKGALSIWSGLIYCAPSIVVLFTAPVWGRFADRHGRKRMVLQTSLGSAATLFLMAFAHHVWLLLILRLLQGLFAGVIPNSTALVATETPKRDAGYAMGLITTGSIGGSLVGPMLGGVLAHVFSIRLSFVITGGLLFVSFIMNLFMVHEHFRPTKTGANQSLFNFHFLKHFPNRRIIAWLLISTAIVQTGLYSVSPIVSLLVKQLMHNRGAVTIVAGVIASLPGIAMFITSSILGKISDRYGANRILILGYVFAVGFYVPQTFITDIVILGIFRFLVGIANAAVYPVIQTMLTKASPADSTGLVFSLNQSAASLGNILGPMIGGEIANVFGYGGTFMFSALFQGINLVLLLLLVPELRWNAKSVLNATE